MKVRSSDSRARCILQDVVEGRDLQCYPIEEIRTARCSSGCSALHWAAGSNRVEAVRYLIEECGMSVNLKITSRQAKNRTPLHYACRNGHLEAVQFLVMEMHADVDPRAKHGVTPFQLAVWQNHLPVCKWLVEECNVDPGQVNDFGCAAIHWLGISPPSRADTKNDSDETGSALLPLAEWLASRPEIDYSSRQRQGHSALHKAAWLGHLAFCRYLHKTHNIWDDFTDDAGNYAADLADMAGTAPRHVSCARFLRHFCSRERAQSFEILGLNIREHLCEQQVREAYKQRVRLVHPDKNSDDRATTDFDELHKAYRHLVVHKGEGTQSNPSHSLKLMLEISGGHAEKEAEDDYFQTRLISVLLEYGDKGLDLSNLKKKWKQVWPDVVFPFPPTTREKRKVSLSEWLQKKADDVIELKPDGKGSLRVHAKHCSRASVSAAASLHS